jgi:hypothetical protein
VSSDTNLHIVRVVSLVLFLCVAALGCARSEAYDAGQTIETGDFALQVGWRALTMFCDGLPELTNPT